jgi:cellulose biosynthesis protein BcsQ
MEQPRPGQIVTFYSVQGGTGCTMAIANIAWILAAAGNKVLVVDWDLEAPSLYRYFEPFLDAGSVMRKSGVIDMLREYEDRIVQDTGHTVEKVRQLAAVDRHTTAVEWAFQGAGQLSILSAGRQNANYSPSLGEQGLSRFFEELNGPDFLEAMRDSMRSNFEYTLIDSRAGYSDMVDICTQYLPDVLVDCYSLSNQAIEGAARTAHSVETFARRGEPSRSIRILPVAMRVDTSFSAKANAGRRIAERAFSGLPKGMADADRRRYFASVEIPYRGDYAFEETLATFGDAPGDPETLLAAYERLTDVITSCQVSSFPAMSSDERLRTLHRFDRAARLEQADMDEIRRYRSALNEVGHRGDGPDGGAGYRP